MIKALRKHPFWAATATLVVAAVVTIAHAALVDQTKTTAAYSNTNFFVENNIIHTVTLAKGGSKRMVLVTASLSAYVYADSTLSMNANINGIGVQAATNPTQPCASNKTCTLSYTWWLDLDAAEQASPGSFNGQPLAVNVQTTSTNSADGYFTLVAQMVKK